MYISVKKFGKLKKFHTSMFSFPPLASFLGNIEKTLKFCFCLTIFFQTLTFSNVRENFNKFDNLNFCILNLKASDFKAYLKSDFLTLRLSLQAPCKQGLGYIFDFISRRYGSSFFSQLFAIRFSWPYIFLKPWWFLMTHTTVHALCKWGLIRTFD